MSTATRVPLTIRAHDGAVIAEANGVEVARLESGRLSVHPAFAGSDIAQRLREFASGASDPRPIIAVDLNGVLDAFA